MSLGFDLHEDDRTFVKDGITGAVRRFAKESLLFPNLIIVSEQDNRVPLHRLNVLPNMFATKDMGDEAGVTADLGINVYYNEGDRTLRLGKIYPRQVKAFLRLFEGNIIVGMLDKDTELKDEFLYVLSD